MPAICDNLKQLRTARGLTQAEVAQRLGVTRQTISSYESGRTMPDLETLKRLTDILGCDLEQLLYGHSPAQRRQKRARRAAWIVLGAILASCLAASLLLLSLIHISVTARARAHSRDSPSAAATAAWEYRSRSSSSTSPRARRATMASRA